MRYFIFLFTLLLAAVALGLSCSSGVPEESPPGLTETASPPARQVSKPGQALREQNKDPRAESAAFGLPLAPLPPKVQQSIEKIRVLRLTDDSLSIIWSLKDKKDAYDLIVLDCSSEKLSTSMVKAIADWAKQGHGLLIQGRHVNQFSHELLPAPCYLEGIPSIDNPQPELAHDNELVRDVSKIANYLWCARRDESLHLLIPLPDGEREYSESEIQHPMAVLEQNGAELFPVLFDRSQLGEGFVLVASRYQNARVAWFSGSIDFSNKECEHQYDDVRLWSNLVHWLSSEGNRGGGAP